MHSHSKSLVVILVAIVVAFTLFGIANSSMSDCKVLKRSNACYHVPEGMGVECHAQGVSWSCQNDILTNQTLRICANAEPLQGGRTSCVGGTSESLCYALKAVCGPCCPESCGIPIEEIFEWIPQAVLEGPGCFG